MRVSQVHYKRIRRVTVGVVRWRILTAQWPWMPSVGQNLHPFIGNVNVSIWVKNSRVGWKLQTNKICICRTLAQPLYGWNMYDSTLNLIYHSTENLTNLLLSDLQRNDQLLFDCVFLCWDKLLSSTQNLLVPI